jgi:hypothetical protein
MGSMSQDSKLSRFCQVNSFNKLEKITRGCAVTHFIKVNAWQYFSNRVCPYYSFETQLKRKIVASPISNYGQIMKFRRLVVWSCIYQKYWSVFYDEIKKKTTRSFYTMNSSLHCRDVHDGDRFFWKTIQKGMNLNTNSTFAKANLID